ncbi:MAG: hypothetical protein PHU42_01125 [Patescibacteria group bacterium]|nr:hypothetical protein [Patescibacteria group bacterium]
MIIKKRIEGSTVFVLTHGDKRMVVGKDKGRLYDHLEKAMKIPVERRGGDHPDWNNWYAVCWNNGGRDMHYADFLFVCRALSEGDPKLTSSVPMELVAADAAAENDSMGKTAASA